MKKLALTIAVVAAFSFANAQEIQQPTQTPTKKKTTATTTKKETVGTDGTTATPATTGTTEKNTGTSVEPKKSSTRMAINEKGLPGEKKPAKTTPAATPK